MDGATLQKRVYAGYAKAALRVGLPHDIYRPDTPVNPLATINKQQTLQASFNPEDMHYRKSSRVGKPTWFALLDGRLVQVGDYIVGPTATYFIAAMPALLPILAIVCNQTIDILRPQQQPGVGALGYGGDIDANETALMTAWPASVVQGTKGERSDVNLPGDVRTPWWLIMIPALPSVILRSGDIIKDDLSRRYVISSAELSEMGWRLTAMQAQT